MKIQKQITLLLMISMLLMLCACGGSKNSGIVQSRRGSGNTAKSNTEHTEEQTTENQKAENQTETEENTDKQETAEAENLWLLTSIDEKNQKLSFQKLSGGREKSFTYDSAGINVLDKYGNTMPFSYLCQGDAAEIIFSEKGEKIKQIQLSDEVWVQDDIYNYSVDETIHAFIIGKTKYSYTDELPIFSKGKRIKFEDFGENDRLRAVGIGKKLVSVSVTKGHGYLELSNTKIFDGSFICVGDKIFAEITPEMRLEVPEGKYLVTVANNGYGGSRKVKIKRDKTTVLNLDELKGEGPKICKITFDVSVEGAVLKIDDKEADYSAPVDVQYGIHTVSVSAEGYDTIKEKLVVNSKEAEIEIALVSSDGQKKGGKTDNDAPNTDMNNSNNANNNNNSNNNNNINNSNNINNNNNSNNNTNNNGNAGNNNNGQNNADTSDYLTTLYNLLTSINKENNSGKNKSSDSSYQDLNDQ